MYFDHCDSPQELAEAINEFMKVETGRRIHFGPGKPKSGYVDLFDRHTDETLRQAYSEARSVAKRFYEQDKRLTPPPRDVEVSPLKGLAGIATWCRSQAKYKKSIMESRHKKITKLTDFILDRCEDTTSISSKANRIHEFVKKGKIKFMPKPVNKPKGNQTKLYDEEQLWQIWPKLKEKIVALPNLKD